MAIPAPAIRGLYNAGLPNLASRLASMESTHPPTCSHISPTPTYPHPLTHSHTHAGAHTPSPALSHGLAHRLAHPPAPAHLTQPNSPPHHCVSVSLVYHLLFLKSLLCAPFHPQSLPRPPLRLPYHPPQLLTRPDNQTSTLSPTHVLAHSHAPSLPPSLPHCLAPSIPRSLPSSLPRAAILPPSLGVCRPC